MDQKASGVSLVKPTSSLDSPRARVNTPPSPPLPPHTPNLPVEQTAPTSTRPTHQRGQNGHIPGNGTCCTCEDDVEGSQGKVELRSRGDREPDDEDGNDVDVDHAHVMPHPPSSTRQTANKEATGTSNPNANSAGTTMPVGTLNRPLNVSKSNSNDEGVEGKGEKGEGNERASGITAPSSNGNPQPTQTNTTPPSMPLEGEKDGEESSGCAHEAATHDVETPQAKLRTTPPLRTPYNQRSSGEGQVLAIGHRQAVGEEDKAREKHID
ncbi:hypothetical protein PAXINDRAFT_20490 [Paxillus involutus ATCC 200175]|uniref:Uncharacterized protein n=1 Tax=Paxillus involutus ATCC 200175 TaxID=664439 RepID=A0A0C9SUV8_PAXIN|nr:hypothetical protein PAXINDRAFT_20490 [Paxillus involutus ATCC 200175]